jgi:hypothetical protein
MPWRCFRELSYGYTTITQTYHIVTQDFFEH